LSPKASGAPIWTNTEAGIDVCLSGESAAAPRDLAAWTRAGRNGQLHDRRRRSEDGVPGRNDLKSWETPETTGKGRGLMSDAEKQDPSGTREDLDLKSFYRATTDADAPNPRHTNGDLDLNSFYRTSSEIARQDSGVPAENLDIKDFYLPHGSEPRESTETPPEPAPHGRGSPYAPSPEQVVEAAKPIASPGETDNIAAESSLLLPPVAPGSGQPLPAPQAPISAIHNPLYRFVAIGGLGGLMFGVFLIFFSWLVATPSGPYDLGLVTSNAFGLKGRLFTKWEQNALQYRISFEPNGPEQNAGFGVAIADPPRPLSIAFQLKDAKGFVLCSKDVLIKYDPASALPPLPPLPEKGKVKKDAPSQADLESARQAQLLRLQTQEAQREQGKDIFQEQTGSDGQIAAISSQGDIPCSKDSYEKVAMWSFSADFPSIAEQDDLLKQRAAAQAMADRAAPAHRRQAPKPVANPLSFAIEGDDVLVGYDPGAGVLETSTGQSFYVDKQANLSGWQVFPLRIHYRCDQLSGCTIVRAGSGAVLPARLRR